MNSRQQRRQQRRIWIRAFFTRTVLPHLLLTPFSTLKRRYIIDDGVYIYLDVYVFGICIARIHKT
jgi:hypothetical protein